MKAKDTKMNPRLAVAGVAVLLLVAGGLMAGGALGDILQPASYLPQVEVAEPYPPPLPTAPPPDLPPRENYTVRDILRISDTLWVATGNGLVELDTTTGQYVRHHKDRYAPVPIYSLETNSLGRLWLGAGDGLYIFDQGQWLQPMPGMSNREDEYIAGRILIDSRDRIWHPHNRGVAIMEPGGSVTHHVFTDETYIGTRDVPPHDCGEVILAVLDGQDRLWMAHQHYCIIDLRWNYYECRNGGVSVIDDQGRWNHFSPDDGTLRSREIWGLGTFADGSAWVNGAGGAELISPDGAERTPGSITAFVTSPAAVRNLVRADGWAWSVQPNGSVWTSTEGFLRFDGASWVDMGADRSPGPNAQELVVVDQQRMWARVADLHAGSESWPQVDYQFLTEWNEETGRWDILYLR